ncbi:zinc knuckle CX2CX4HX4C containing protein [Tanacetum coccineum]|uniref:Zinc knuckle CX2CX4HX4C containing protein n=1 Tax=Tanacetum coccineum TaxID=301880 RepID=A0ABQ4WU01_9ASTR
MNRQLLDSQGPIPKMTPTQALTAIQTMADHSQKWHDGTSNRNISSSSDTDGLAAVISKLDNFRRDMKKLKENIHAIQVGCQICEGPHLDKECPLNEEVKQVDEVKYGEFRRPAPFNGSNKAKFRVENDPGSFILPCSIERLDVNNALADLGASSIMPFLMFKRLGIGKLEPIDMVIEMADDTKCIPKGIVKNMLIKIDKFILPIDFVILDMIEDFRMPAILGRHLLATAHEKVDIFRKTISLEVGNEKVIFKTRSNFSDNIHESVRMIKTKMNTEEDELMKRDYDVFTYNTNACEINHLLSVDPDMFTYDIEVQESYEEIVYKCSLIAQEANGGFSRDSYESELGLLEGKQKSSGEIFDNIKYLILFSVKCKYEIRNTGNGPKIKKTRILTRLYGVTPTIVLSHPSQNYGVTCTLDYAVTSFRLARWKVRVSSLRRKPLKALRSDQGFYTSKNSTRSLREITLNLLLYLIVHKSHLLWFRWISFDYRVTLGFGSIAGGLDHVNPVIRLPIEHGISKGTKYYTINDLSTENIDRYYADIKVMNYILQGIPNDIYNSFDACKDAQGMWQRVKRLLQVTLTLQSHRLSTDRFDRLYVYLSQCEPHVNASRAKKTARNHDPLALVVNSYANPSYSHANPSYSRSPQPYYVTHPPSVHDYDDDYQGKIQEDA